MADFRFEKDNKKLKCIYQFNNWYSFNVEKLDTEDGIPIRRTFL